jgi:quercetin dioxygenase-like cupin family protein
MDRIDDGHRLPDHQILEVPGVYCSPVRFDVQLHFAKRSRNFGGRMRINEFFSVDTSEQPWEERYNEKIGKAILRKKLYTDPDTGAEVRLVRYPAGVVNPLHTHPCGHGLYVLEGQLVTHKGTFGSGTFVWFPEGEIMEHGASPEADVTVLFITNKRFRIDYVD